MTLSARLASTGEAGLVHDITAKAYAEFTAAWGRPPIPVTEDHAPRIEAGQVWLVLRDAVVAGVAVFETEADHLLIFNLAVLPGQRGGVGRFMLALAEERARAAGLDEIRLYTNARMERNIVVYGKAGYVETGRRPPPARADWIVVDMVKRLGPAQAGAGASTIPG